MEKVINSDEWVRYADIVGDCNPIHRDGEYVRNSKLLQKLGITDIVAPGMYIGAHVQGSSKIRNVELAFKNPVYNGDVIQERDNSFYRGDDLVCRGNVVLGDPTKRAISLPNNIVYQQDFYASVGEVRSFLDLVSSGVMRSDSEMYLMALSAPTLLGYAKGKNLVGMHAYQSMEVHKPVSLDHVRVSVEESKVGSRMCKMNLYWESSGEVIATGESKVLPLVV